MELNSRQTLESLGTPEYLSINFSSWRDDPVGGLLKRVQESMERFPTMMPGPTLPSSGLPQSLQSYATHANVTLLIILDQFEEYFLYHARELGEGSFAIEFVKTYVELFKTLVWIVVNQLLAVTTAQYHARE